MKKLLNPQLICCGTLALALATPSLGAGLVRRIDIVGPPGSEEFGSSILALPSGNLVIADRRFDLGSTPDVGAVYLYRPNGQLISRLTGSNAYDMVGEQLHLLTNGNFLVGSDSWGGAPGLAPRGAVTWVNGVTGLNGAVSAGNSLVAASGSSLGWARVTALPNGHYVLAMPSWSVGESHWLGAVTWGNGVTGTTGIVSAANSLVGDQPDDEVGGGSEFGPDSAVVLENGNYVVISNDWRGKRGAVTWCPGISPCIGVVSASNSLIGSNEGDAIGYGGVLPLSTGHYFVSSQRWMNPPLANVGAVTWGNGNGGSVGVVSASNSIVGSSAGDSVSLHASNPVVLAGGNIAMPLRHWNNGSAVDAGAVVWLNSSGGSVGPVSSANALVGTSAGDQVGSDLIVLDNGNYVVSSPNWDRASLADAGAVTWGDGMTGVSGPVGLANSLVGTAPADRVGYRLTKLVSGGAVAQTQSWNNGAAVDAGAATWINPGAPTIGEVSALNSLVGSTTNDRVSNSGVTALANGNYVVASMNWNAPGASSAGAATWGDGMSGTTGVVSASNSLIGSTAYDNVGYNVVPLSNGHYVASSSFWDHAGLVDAGAVTWCDGFVGAAGPVNMSNSLVGGAMHDGVGSVQALPNGNYVVDSGGWANGASADAGAVTWGNGLGGTSGLVSSANSFVGANSESIAGRVRLLSGGAYAIVSYNWDDGARQDVGAVRWSDGLAAITGTHSSTVSLLGASTGDFFGAIDDVGAGHFLLRSDRWSNGPAAFSGAIFSGNGAATGLITSENAWVGDSDGDSVGWDDPVIYPDGLFVLKARTFDHNGLQNVGAVTVGNRSVQPRGIVSEENSCIGTIEYGGVGNIARFPNEQRVAVQSKGNRVVIFDLPIYADGLE